MEELSNTPTPQYRIIATPTHFTDTFLINARIVFVALVVILSAGSSIAQTDVVVNNLPEEETPLLSGDWEIRVVWIDRHGRKRKTKGWLLMALETNILVQNWKTSRHETIYAEDIVKVKYSPPYNEAPDVLLGAADGLVSGGFLPITTGNVYLDLLSGAVQGAVTGLINTSGNSRTTYVNRRPDVYLNRVYPELTGQ